MQEVEMEEEKPACSSVKMEEKKPACTSVKIEEEEPACSSVKIDDEKSASVPGEANSVADMPKKPKVFKRPSLNPKRPYQLLNEMMPGLEYILINTEGPVHTCTYTFEITVFGRKYKGAASSKKGAKERAADLALRTCIAHKKNRIWDILTRRVSRALSDEPETVTVDEAQVLKLIEEIEDNSIKKPDPASLRKKDKSKKAKLKPKNPVFLLHELHPFTEFTLVNTRGPIRTPVYIYEVVVNGIAYVGEGKSKKQARIKAATKALTAQIKDHDSDIYEKLARQVTCTPEGDIPDVDDDALIKLIDTESPKKSKRFAGSKADRLGRIDPPRHSGRNDHPFSDVWDSDPCPRPQQFSVPQPVSLYNQQSMGRWSGGPRAAGSRGIDNGPPLPHLPSQHSGWNRNSPPAFQDSASYRGPRPIHGPQPVPPPTFRDSDVGPRPVHAPQPVPPPAFRDSDSCPEPRSIHARQPMPLLNQGAGACHQNSSQPSFESNYARQRESNRFEIDRESMGLSNYSRKGNNISNYYQEIKRNKQVLNKFPGNANSENDLIQGEDIRFGSHRSGANSTSSLGKYPRSAEPRSNANYLRLSNVNPNSSEVEGTDSTFFNDFVEDRPKRPELNIKDEKVNIRFKIGSIVKVATVPACILNALSYLKMKLTSICLNDRKLAKLSDSDFVFKQYNSMFDEFVDIESDVQVKEGETIKVVPVGGEFSFENLLWSHSDDDRSTDTNSEAMYKKSIQSPRSERLSDFPNQDYKRKRSKDISPSKTRDLKTISEVQTEPSHSTSKPSRKRAAPSQTLSWEDHGGPSQPFKERGDPSIIKRNKGELIEQITPKMITEAIDREKGGKSEDDIEADQVFWKKIMNLESEASFYNPEENEDCEKFMKYAMKLDDDPRHILDLKQLPRITKFTQHAIALDDSTYYYFTVFQPLLSSRESPCHWASMIPAQAKRYAAIHTLYALEKKERAPEKALYVLNAIGPDRYRKLERDLWHGLNVNDASRVHHVSRSMAFAVHQKIYEEHSA